jgi:uncharacterized protein YbbC (DUF1343 family)
MNKFFMNTNGFFLKFRLPLPVVGFLFLIPFCMLNLQALELGIDVLQSQNFSDLKDKKVALLTNASGFDSKGS